MPICRELLNLQRISIISYDTQQNTPFEPMARSLKGLLKDNQPSAVYARMPYYLEIK